MNGSNTYAERQTVFNKGEVLFENYCNTNNYECRRIGFDEKHKSVSNFYHLSCLLRNLPDYVMTKPDGTFIVNVKGTANFKKREIDLIPLFLEWFSTKDAPLVYAFCFDDCDPLFVYPEAVIRMYNLAENKRWHDGVTYRTLNFSDLL